MRVERVLRLARAICPQGPRERRFEEWRADVAGCRELEISSASIAAGALRLAVAERVRLVRLRVVHALVRGWTVAVGVLLGATCAVCGISVLAVVVVALLLQGVAFAIVAARRRARKQHARGIEISR